MNIVKIKLKKELCKKKKIINQSCMNILIEYILLENDLFMILNKFDMYQYF